MEHGEYQHHVRKCNHRLGGISSSPDSNVTWAADLSSQLIATLHYVKWKTRAAKLPKPTTKFHESTTTV